MKTEWKGKLFVGILGQAPRLESRVNICESTINLVKGKESNMLTDSSQNGDMVKF